MSARLATSRLNCSGFAALPRRSRAARRMQQRVMAAAQTQQQQALAFHIAETTVSFPLKAEEARKLSEALNGVMQTFAEKQKAERPKRWPALEYVYKGEGGELEFLEVFCNPNAHSTAFDARALISLRTAGGLRVTTEAKLTGVKADVEEYLSTLA